MRAAAVRGVLGCAALCVAVMSAASCEGGSDAAASSVGFDWADLPVMGRAVRSDPAVIVRFKQVAFDGEAAAYAECMSSRGFPEAQIGGLVDESVALYLSRPRSVADANEHGVGLTDDRRALAQHEASQSAARPTEPTPAELDALMAASERCRQGTDTPGSKAGLRELFDSYATDVIGDRRIQAARVSWRNCLEEHGYEATGLTTLRDLLLGRVSEPLGRYGAMSPDERDEFDSEQRAAERSAALAVIDCDRQSYEPVIEHWIDLEEAWQEQHAAALRSASWNFYLPLPAQSGI